MNNHDYITQDSEPEDRIYLHRKLFPVSIRLLKSSPPYREHIQGILQYMEWTLDQKWDDYASAKDGGTYGISGANLAIPYNIIGWRKKDDNKFGYMLNPVLTKMSDMQVETKSNCGSIKLSEKIAVLRFRQIKVSWYDIKGGQHEQEFTIKDCGSTIQHEIDHNNGILIIDRFVEQGGSFGDIAHLFPKKRVKDEQPSKVEVAEITPATAGFAPVGQSSSSVACSCGRMNAINLHGGGVQCTKCGKQLQAPLQKKK